MSFLEDADLVSLGWSPQYQFYFDELQEPELVPARILSEDKSLYTVQLPRGTQSRAVLSGKLRLQIDSGDGLKPAVGDWIACEVPSMDHDAVLIRAVLPRKTCVARAHPEGGAQVMACNVDTIFIVTSANGEFNLNRLERYVAITFDSGAEPVIVLTKTDLSKKEELKQIQEHFPSVEAFGVTMKDRLSYVPLFRYFEKGMTVALLGSSGVGKSTLVNYVMGYEKQKTYEVNESNSKGRHTTTRREFIQTPFGGWIADTPGMREIGLLDQQMGVQSQYAEIFHLAKQCRFKDCSHESEPGCAILRALKNGELDPQKWQNYLKLKAELEYYERRGNKALEAEQKQVWKQIHKDLKASYKLGKK